MIEDGGSSSVPGQEDGEANQQSSDDRVSKLERLQTLIAASIERDAARSRYADANSHTFTLNCLPLYFSRWLSSISKNLTTIPHLADGGRYYLRSSYPERLADDQGGTLILN